MAIKSYTGNLLDVGPHQPDKEGLNFVYIDIDGKYLKNVKSVVVVGEFLLRGVGMEGNSTLWINHMPAVATLLGVQLPNGRRVHLDVASQTSLLFIYSLAPLILLILGASVSGGANAEGLTYTFYFLALLFLCLPYLQWKKVQALKRIARGELFN